MMMCWHISWCPVICLFLLMASATTASRLSAEGKLIQKLTSSEDYERFAAPNSYNYTTVNFSIHASRMVDIDDRNQESSLASYLILTWNDPRLTWNATEHGVTELLFSSEQIWVPDIGLHNSLDSTFDLADQNKYRIAVASDGTVQWYPGSLFRIPCELDMTDFPFDEQECFYRFGSWSQSERYIRMKAVSEKVLLNTGHVENGQWMPISSQVLDEIYKPNELLPGWSRVWVIVRLKRRPAFYIINLVIPCMAISVLVLMVFYIPSESGEKVSLGVTILLAFSVFQLVMADTLPKSSHDMPIIVIYLTTLMITSALSTILAVVMLNIHGRSGKKVMPIWMQRVVFNFLARLVCMGEVANQFRVKQKGKLARKTARLSADVVPAMSNGTARPVKFVNTSEMSVKSASQTNDGQTQSPAPTRFVNLGEMALQAASKTKEERSTSPKPTKFANLGEMAVKAASKTNNDSGSSKTTTDAFSQLLQEKRMKREKQERVEREELMRIRWVLASRIIDRFLMVIYFVVYAALTLICMVILPNIPKHKHAEGIPDLPGGSI